MSKGHKAASRPRPRDRKLCTHVTRDGVLRIEIGVEALKFAALAMPDTGHVIGDRYIITDARGFARDVMHAMLDDDEAGYSALTRMIDKAIDKAIEDGSEHVIPKEETT